MTLIYEFALILIFGGMIAFQALFAPLLFIKLEQQTARKFIRAFFPWYYIYFGVLTLAATITSFINELFLAGFILAICFIGFVIARQYLMLQANNASDAGDKQKFNLYHRATVLINTLQLIAFGYLLYV